MAHGFGTLFLRSRDVFERRACVVGWGRLNFFGVACVYNDVVIRPRLQLK